MSKNIQIINKQLISAIKEIKQKYKIKYPINLIYTKRRNKVGLTTFDGKQINIGISSYSVLKYGKDEAQKLLNHELAHAICMAKKLDPDHNSPSFLTFCKELGADPNPFCGKSLVKSMKCPSCRK